MGKYSARSIILFIIVSLATIKPVSGKTVVFYEKDFPAVENGTISRPTLEGALAPLNPLFVTLDDLQNGNMLAEGDLLVFPYGSAVPADVWETIRRFLDHGNLLILGGRPFYSAVFRDTSIWRIESPQCTYSRYLGIEYAYVAPQHGPWTLQWDEDAPFFHGTTLNPLRVFVNAGYGGRYRGLGYLVNNQGDRLAAPIVAEDLTGRALPPSVSQLRCGNVVLGIPGRN
jgi:hypothetical protein